MRVAMAMVSSLQKLETLTKTLPDVKWGFQVQILPALCYHLTQGVDTPAYKLRPKRAHVQMVSNPAMAKQ